MAPLTCGYCQEVINAEGPCIIRLRQNGSRVWAIAHECGDGPWKTIRLGECPLPSSHLDAFLYHWHHGRLMRYPLVATLSFAWRQRRNFDPLVLDLLESTHSSAPATLDGESTDLPDIHVVGDHRATGTTDVVGIPSVSVGRRRAGDNRVRRRLPRSDPDFLSCHRPPPLSSIRRLGRFVSAHIAKSLTSGDGDR
jgi:hypothetical protein